MGCISATSISIDRKSTRLNSSHLVISYAVFCLKKKIMRLELARKVRRQRASRSLACMSRRRQLLLSGRCLLAAGGFQFFHFFFNDTATTEIYTLSLHDALPILKGRRFEPGRLEEGKIGRVPPI